MPLKRHSQSSLLSKLLLLCFGIEIAQAFTSLGLRSPCRLVLSARTRTAPFSSNQLYMRHPYLRQKTDLSFFRRKEETEDSRIESSPNVFNFFSDEKHDPVIKDSKTEKDVFMGDLVKLFGKAEPEVVAVAVADPPAKEVSLTQIVAVGAIAVTAAATVTMSLSGDVSENVMKIQSFFADPTATLDGVVDMVKSMGPLGYLYFGAAYTVAEILAIPAIPLTASAGYLFGVRDGTAVVLVSASIAAAVSFVIGRTFLRSYVEKALEDYPDFKKIDKAIGEEGFKLMLLLRVSPIFPFALSNYLYGVTSIRFWPYFWGTMIGFFPGTVAYVYTGDIGKSLTLGSASAEPWYVYAGILALLSGFIKVVSDVATGIIEKSQEEDE